MDSFAIARDGEMHEATRRVLSVLLRQVKPETFLSWLYSEHDFFFFFLAHTHPREKCLDSLLDKYFKSLPILYQI